MLVLDNRELHKTRFFRADYRLGRLDIAARKQVWREQIQPEIIKARKSLDEAAQAMKDNPSPDVNAAYIRARLALNKLYKLSAQIWS